MASLIPLIQLFDLNKIVATLITTAVTRGLVWMWKAVVSMNVQKPRKQSPRIDRKTRFKNEAALFVVIALTVFSVLSFIPLIIGGQISERGNEKGFLPRIIFMNLGVKVPVDSSTGTEEEINQRMTENLQKEPPRQRPVGVQIGLEIFNKGRPSVLHDWKLEVLLKSGQTITSDLDTNIPLKTTLLSEKNARPLVLKRENWIIPLTRNEPVGTGKMVEGFISFTIPGIDRETVQLPGNKLRLTFHDVDQQEYEVEYVISGQVGFY